MGTPVVRASRPGAGRIWVPAAIGLVTVVGLWLLADADLAGAIRQVDLSFVLLAALKPPCLLLLWTYRWQMVLRARHVPVRFGQTLVAILVRTYFNALTPGAGTGGEPVAAYYLSRRVPMPMRDALASTAAERMVMGVGLVLILALALGACWPSLSLAAGLPAWVAAGFTAFVAVTGLLLYLSVFRLAALQRVVELAAEGAARLVPPLSRLVSTARLGPAVSSFGLAYRAYLIQPRVYFWVGAATAAHWSLDVLQHYLLFRGLHAEIPLWTIVVAATTVKIAGVVAILPGGAGFMEGINYGIYTVLTGLPRDAILAETILFRALDAWVLWVVSGIATALAGAALHPEPDPSVSSPTHKLDRGPGSE